MEEDFYAPVYSAITSPILIGGVPREFAILNLTFSMNLTMGLQSWLGVPIGIVVHLVARFFAKRDPYFLHVFRRHMRWKDYYHV